MKESFESIGAATEAPESLDIQKKFLEQEQGIFLGLKGKAEKLAKVLGLVSAMAGLSVTIPKNLEAKEIKGSVSAEKLANNTNEHFVLNPEHTHSFVKDALSYFNEKIDIPINSNNSEEIKAREEAVQYYVSNFIKPIVLEYKQIIKQKLSTKDDIRKFKREYHVLENTLVRIVVEGYGHLYDHKSYITPLDFDEAEIKP